MKAYLMRIIVLVGMILAVFATGCKRNPSASKKLNSKLSANGTLVHSDSSNQSPLGSSQGCTSGLSLLFEDNEISSYTEDSIRGVVSK